MKKINKSISLTLALMTSATALVGLASCGGGGSGEKIDKTKTQVYVWNFGGGFGSDWLYAAKKRYEAIHAEDTHWEEGKKGVQVYITTDKKPVDSVKANIKHNKEEVYFAERCYYYTLVSEGVLGDITEAVVNTSPYDNKTVESKLTDVQKDYYTVENGTDTKYYGLPHYASYAGFTYNVDLFEERGFYFAKTPDDVLLNSGDISGYFIYNDTDKKSAGPDGVEGTTDDGLPSTYAEFFILCDYVAREGCTPVIWNGKGYKDYLNRLLESLIVDCEGLDQTTLKYTLDGVATTLGKVVNNEWVPDANPTTITLDNGYETYRAEGYYRALEFFQKLVQTDKYHNEDAFRGSHTHLNAQEDYLWGGYDGGNTAPAAMLVEGVWWEMEATPTFNDMKDSKGDKLSKENRRFAWMPLPKATADKVGEKHTLIEHSFSMCFMKPNVSEAKKPLVLDFIQFINSDASLVEYSQITSTTKALKYTMTDAEKSVMTHFGQSLISHQENSDVAYPYATHTEYQNDGYRFSDVLMLQSTGYEWAAEAFHGINGKKANALSYFEEMYKYYKKNWF